MDYQNGGTILHGAWIFAVNRKFLAEIRSLSVATGFETEEKHARFLLAYRSRERHSFAPKHRTECALVLHRASRARPRLLFQSLHPSGGSLSATTGRGARIS